MVKRGEISQSTILNFFYQREMEPSSTVQSLVEAWSVTELDAFFADVDFPEPDCDVRSDRAHWLCRSSECKKKNRQGEVTAMYRMGGQKISRQRITYILEMHQDPIQMARLKTRCGVEQCINPYHLELIPRKKDSIKHH